MRGFLIFVYGTLMRGEAGHAYIAHCRFEGAARTLPHYRLVDLGGYPGLVGGGTSAVCGELYTIDEATIPLVDAYEDVPELYVRRHIGLDCGVPAQAYLLRASMAGTCPSIPSADWRRR